MGGLSCAARPTHNPAVDSVDLDGGVLLYDGQQLRLLSGTAAIIWRAIDGGASVRELLAALAAGDEYVERDVLAFLDELVDQGLVYAPPVDDVARYVVASNVAHVVDEAQTLLLDMQTGQRRALSQSASMIWGLLRADSDPRTIAADLRRSYPDAPASVATEVIGLLDELVAAGFLVRHS